MKEIDQLKKITLLFSGSDQEDPDPKATVRQKPNTQFSPALLSFKGAWKLTTKGQAQPVSFLSGPGLGKHAWHPHYVHSGPNLEQKPQEHTHSKQE